MKRHPPWDDFVQAFDYTTTHTKTNSLSRWISWKKTETGLQFTCQTAMGESATVLLDVVFEDTIRFRMNPVKNRILKSVMLVNTDFDWVPFEIEETDGQIDLRTDDLRVEIPQYPWGIRIYDRSSEAPIPFFSQQNEDRAYGPGFEVFPVGYDTDDKGRAIVRESIDVTPGEAFYGLGERFSDLNRWGQELNFWAVDSGNVTSGRAYKNVPFFMSTAGYGLFVHSSFPMVYRMGSESNASYSFHILDNQLDYFILRGPSFKKMIKTYTKLTGAAPIPPKWSFGFWISRCMYMSRQEVEGVVNGMRTRGFPLDVLSIDPYWMGEAPWCTYEFDQTAFPKPEEMIEKLKGQNVRTCLWVTPYVPKGLPIYEEARDQNFLAVGPDGEPARVLEAFAGLDLACLDVTNPAACEWFQGKLRKLLDMGVATFKTDFAEQSPIEATYQDGSTGLEMHNVYPMLYNKIVFELTKEHFGRGLVWGRAGYSGSQRYPVQWGGDSYASFPQMTGQLRGLLGYGMSGVPFCSHDVGGFDYPPRAFDYEDLDAFPRDAELYIRWLQFGVFSSHLRAHGKQPREPWEYGLEAAEIAMKYLKLRYRLLPYIYSEAVRSSRSSLPMVRPLVLEYQDDPNTKNIDLQYLFGPDFLVAPMLTRSNRRSVYLPKGDWYDFWTKEKMQGGRWIEVEAPLETLPLWVRSGAVIPFGPEMDFVDQIPLNPMTLELYGLTGRGECVVFDEEQPKIKIHTSLDGTTLNLEVENPPENVEIHWFGMQVSAVICNQQFLKMDGQSARYKINQEARGADLRSGPG
jgi:alpha-D-xyloside xylohydrolase